MHKLKILLHGTVVDVAEFSELSDLVRFILEFWSTVKVPANNIGTFITRYEVEGQLSPEHTSICQTRWTPSDYELLVKFWAANRTQRDN